MPVALLATREIHKFKQRGQYILFDVESCSVSEIDRLTYDVLNLFEKPAPSSRINALQCTYDALQLEHRLNSLLNEGVLVPFESRPPKKSPEYRKINSPEYNPIVRLSLNISERCNMQCGYCYARGGTYYGGASRMTEGVADKAVDFLIDESNDEKRCSIIFFGGEPLLGFDLLKHVVCYARKEAAKVGKTITFSILTNGTLIDEEIAAFFDENGVAVNVSIDGPKEIHDLARCFANGEGSYEVLIPKIELLRNTQKIPVNAKPTITHQDPDAWRVYSYLLSLGFTSMKMEPVSSQDANFSMAPEDIGTFNQHLTSIAYDLLERWLEGQAINFITFTEPIAKLYAGNKNFYRCDAGLSFLAVSARGDLYPCYAFPGMTDFKLGNVLDGLDKDKRKDFQKYTHVDSRKPCCTCWARYICGGECYYHSAKFTKGIESVSGNVCEYYKRVAELSLFLYLNLKNEDILFASYFYQPLRSYLSKVLCVK